MNRPLRPLRALTGRAGIAVVLFAGIPALAACSGDNPYEAGKAAQSAPAATSAPSSTSGGGDGIEDNGFLPTGQDVTDCVGTVELPNCGSKDKGGWRMYLVMAVLVMGVAFIAWRVTRLVRRRDAIVNAEQNTAGR